MRKITIRNTTDKMPKSKIRRGNRKLLIAGTYVLDVDSISSMEYVVSERKWLDVVIRTKNAIPDGLFSEEMQIVYILKNCDLFHIKPVSIATTNNCITIVPKLCGLLDRNINGSL